MWFGARVFGCGMRLKMLTSLLHEASGRTLGVLVGMMAGSLITAIIAQRRRLRERRRILEGDARDTVVIHQHVIESAKVVDPSGVARSAGARY